MSFRLYIHVSHFLVDHYDFYLSRSFLLCELILARIKKMIDAVLYV